MSKLNDTLSSIIIGESSPLLKDIINSTLSSEYDKSGKKSAPSNKAEMEQLANAKYSTRQLYNYITDNIHDRIISALEVTEFNSLDPTVKEKFAYDLTALMANELASTAKPAIEAEIETKKIYSLSGTKQITAVNKAAEKGSKAFEKEALKKLTKNIKTLEKATNVKLKLKKDQMLSIGDAFISTKEARLTRQLGSKKDAQQAMTAYQESRAAAAKSASTGSIDSPSAGSARSEEPAASASASSESIRSSSAGSARSEEPAASAAASAESPRSTQPEKSIKERLEDLKNKLNKKGLSGYQRALAMRDVAKLIKQQEEEAAQNPSQIQGAVETEKKKGLLSRLFSNKEPEFSEPTKPKERRASSVKATIEAGRALKAAGVKSVDSKGSAKPPATPAATPQKPTPPKSPSR